MISHEGPKKIGDHSSGAAVAGPPRCDLPGQRPEDEARRSANSGCHPYTVLLPVGFTMPALSPAPRCALTAPFHPYPRVCSLVGRAGGLLSVALSLRSPSPAVSRHRVSMEPGLSSTGAETPPAIARPPGFFRVGTQQAQHNPPIATIATAYRHTRRRRHHPPDQAGTGVEKLSQHSLSPGRRSRWG